MRTWDALRDTDADVHAASYPFVNIMGYYRKTVTNSFTSSKIFTLFIANVNDGITSLIYDLGDLNNNYSSPLFKVITIIASSFFLIALHALICFSVRNIFFRYLATDKHASK